MIPPAARHSLQIMRRYAVLVFICLYALGVVPAGAQTDRVSRLMTQMRGKDDSKRRNAMQALIKIGPPAVEALIASLKDPHDYGREYAIEALGEIKDPPGH